MWGMARTGCQAPTCCLARGHCRWGAWLGSGLCCRPTDLLLQQCLVSGPGLQWARLFAAEDTTWQVCNAFQYVTTASVRPQHHKRSAFGQRSNCAATTKRAPDATLFYALVLSTCNALHDA